MVLGGRQGRDRRHGPPGLGTRVARLWSISAAAGHRTAGNRWFDVGSKALPYPRFLELRGAVSASWRHHFILCAAFETRERRPTRVCLRNGSARIGMGVHSGAAVAARQVVGGRLGPVAPQGLCPPRPCLGGIGPQALYSVPHSGPARRTDQAGRSSCGPLVCGPLVCGPLVGCSPGASVALCPASFSTVHNGPLRRGLGALYRPISARCPPAFQDPAQGAMHRSRDRRDPRSSKRLAWSLGE